MASAVAAYAEEKLLGGTMLAKIAWNIIPQRSGPFERQVNARVANTAVSSSGEKDNFCQLLK